MDAGLERSSRKDAADWSGAVAGVPIAIEMRLHLDRRSPGTVLVTVGNGSAERSQHRIE